MWNPATALLWECWRLSRRILAIQMFVPMLLGATLLFAWLVVPADEHPPDLQQGPTWALLFAVLAGIMGWTWAANVDGRRGFKLALGFARPIPTWVLVSVPMAYIGVSCALVYLVPMLTLRATFGIPFPLFPMAALVSTLSLVLCAVSWWSGDPARRRVAWSAVSLLWLVGWLWLVNVLPPRELDLVRSPEIFSFSATAYGAMALASVAAVGLTLVGVARQRRGDNGRVLARGASKPGARPSLAERLGRCPVSSPTRAQLWFEMRTVGGTVLKVGALTALVGPAALTVAARQRPFLTGLMFVAPLIIALRSMLGVRRKQGSAYLDAFAASRAMGTARLVGLKVLVTSLSVLAAWALIGTSLWIFAVRLGVWGPNVAADFASVPSWPAYAWIGAVAAVVTAMGGGLTLHALLVLNARRVLLSGVGLGVGRRAVGERRGHGVGHPGRDPHRSRVDRRRGRPSRHGDLAS